MAMNVMEQPYHISKFGGQDTTIRDTALPPEKGDIAQNCRFGTVGSLIKRGAIAQYNASTMGAAAVTSIFRFYRQSGDPFLLASCNQYMQVSTGTTGSWDYLDTLDSSGTKFTYVVYGDLCLYCDGTEEIMQTDGSATWQLGSCKAGTATTGGNLDASAAYKYMVVFNTASDGSGTDTINGAISNTITTTAANKTIPLTNIPLGDSTTASRVIYRTEGGGSTYKLLDVIENNTETEFEDDIIDSSLGAAVSAVTDDMPNGKYLYVAQERLFVAGNSTYPNHIFYSDQFLPHSIQTSVAVLSTTRPTDYYDVIDEDDGDEITGLIEFQGVTYIFKKNSIRPYQVKGVPGAWILGDSITPIGCPAPYTIQHTQSGIIYQGYGHFYRFNGQYAEPFIDEFPVEEMISDTNRLNSNAFFWNNLYLCCYTSVEGGGDTHDRVMIYDTLRKQLEIDKGGVLGGVNVNINCLSAFRGSTEWGQLYAGDAKAGWVYQYDRAVNQHFLNSKHSVDLGTHSDTMAVGTEYNSRLGKMILDNMEEHTTDAVAQDAWVASEQTEKRPPDLGDGSDGARTVGGTGSITEFSGTSDGVLVYSEDHTMEDGDEVTITGTTNYNGTYTVDNAEDDTFEINADWVADDATGTWTGGDVTINGTKNWTTFTVAAGKTVTVDAGATFKVQGTATISGAIEITGAMQLYAMYVTIGAAGSITGTSWIRTNTLTITSGGVLETDLCQLSEGETTYTATGDCRSGCGLIEPHENITDGDFDTACSSLSSGMHSGSCSLTSTFNWQQTNLSSVRYKIGTISTWATKSGSYGGSGSYTLKLKIDDEWIEIASGSGTSSSGGTDTTDSTGWQRVTGIKAETSAFANGVDREYSARCYHWELQAKGYPRTDYINSSGTVPPSEDTDDFVNPLDSYSETRVVREGTYALRIECAEGADTLNETLTQTLATAMDLSSSTHDDILIDVYATRSGTNFQFGMGETTPTYVNVPVATANTWETVTLDFSGLGDSSKDAVDTLAFRFTNTDSWNTVYVDNIRTARNENAVYVSPPLKINSQSLGSFYWNENLAVVGTTTYGNVQIFTRASTTQALVEDGLDCVATHASNLFTDNTHGMSNGDRIMFGGTTPAELNTYTMYYIVEKADNTFKVSLTSGGSAVAFSDDGTSVTYKQWDGDSSNLGLTNPAGSAITSTANIWFQYLVLFTSSDTTGVYYPYLYTAYGYLLRFTYWKVPATAEASVPFRYRSGYKNFGLPHIDKIYKKIVCIHEGDTKSYNITWECENGQTGVFNVDLEVSDIAERRWESFFQSDAYGRNIRFLIEKDDAEEFELKEIVVIFEPQPIIT